MHSHVHSDHLGSTVLRNALVVMEACATTLAVSASALLATLERGTVSQCDYEIVLNVTGALRKNSRTASSIVEKDNK